MYIYVCMYIYIYIYIYINKPYKYCFWLLSKSTCNIPTYVSRSLQRFAYCQLYQPVWQILHLE